MAYAFGDQSGSAYDGYEFNTPLIQPSLKSTKKSLIIRRTLCSIFIYIFIYQQAHYRQRMKLDFFDRFLHSYWNITGVYLHDQ